jgi:hypothetical protein
LPFCARSLTGRTGCHDASASAPRLCSTRGSVVSRLGVTRPAARSPPRVLVSSGR